jgi:hypothetical protein
MSTGKTGTAADTPYRLTGWPELPRLGKVPDPAGLVRLSVLSALKTSTTSIDVDS